MPYSDYSSPIDHFELLPEPPVDENMGEGAGAALGQQWLVPPDGMPAARGAVAGQMAGRAGSPAGFPPAAMGMPATPGNGDLWWREPARISAHSRVANLPLLDGVIHPSFDSLLPTAYEVFSGDPMIPLMQDGMFPAVTEFGQALANDCKPPAEMPQVLAPPPHLEEKSKPKESLRDLVDLHAHEKSNVAAENAMAQSLHLAPVGKHSSSVRRPENLEAVRRLFFSGYPPIIGQCESDEKNFCIFLKRLEARPECPTWDHFRGKDAAERQRVLDMMPNGIPLLQAIKRQADRECLIEKGFYSNSGMQALAPAALLCEPKNLESVTRLFHTGHPPSNDQLPADEGNFCIFLQALEKRWDCRTWDAFRWIGDAQQQEILRTIPAEAKQATVRQLERECFVRSGANEMTWINCSPAGPGQPTGRGPRDRLGRPLAKRTSFANAKAAENARALAAAAAHAARTPYGRVAPRSDPRTASSRVVQRQPARPPGLNALNRRPVAQQALPARETSTGGSHVASLVEPQAYSQTPTAGWSEAPMQAHLPPSGGIAGSPGMENPAVSQGAVVAGEAFNSIDDKISQEWKALEELLGKMPWSFESN
jgi:hypothetical protein